MKSFHELAAEVAMEKLKSNLAKEAKKAPCRSEDIAEEHGCSCNDGGECKCDTDADCCDCNATNEAVVKEYGGKYTTRAAYLKPDPYKGEATGDKFVPHMMYDPKTGKAYKAEKEADHNRMKKMGYSHDKPETNEDDASARMYRDNPNMMKQKGPGGFKSLAPKAKKSIKKTMKTLPTPTKEAAIEDVKVKSADKKSELVNVDGKLVTRMVPTTKRQADKKDDVEEGKKPGLWANMHARRKAGKPKLKPGDKNYPKTLDIESKEESANLKLINRIKNSGVVKTGSMSKDAPVKKTNEAAPKITGDSIKIQRAKDAEHNAAMGRTNTGRKKPVRTMTSTQKALASLRREDVEQIDELTAAEKKLVNQMYDKKGNLTPLGKRVMDHGKKAK